MGRQTPDRVVHPPEQKIETYDRKRRAAELRRHGWKWHEIAAEVGYADAATTYNAVQRLLKEHQSLAYDEIAIYRQESLDRLTDLLKVAMKGALAGDEKMMREARLIISQIGDLTGEKAPIKHEIGESDVDRAIRELDAEIERRAAGIAREAGPLQKPSGP